MQSEDLEDRVSKAILVAVDAAPDGVIASHEELFATLLRSNADFTPALLDAKLKSLCYQTEQLALTRSQLQRTSLSPNGTRYLEIGMSPERLLFEAIPSTPEGCLRPELSSLLENLSSVTVSLTDLIPDIVRNGLGNAKRNKWINLRKASDGLRLFRAPEPNLTDSLIEKLKLISEGETGGFSSRDLTQLKKRKMILSRTVTVFRISKGSKFSTIVAAKLPANLTSAMLEDGSWQSQDFKSYNFDALGKVERQGYLHPLLKVKLAFKKIFWEMGFEEMRTNNFVESSFWNFDSLFQPQQHPCRDAHDTFFLKRPAVASAKHLPPEYVEIVKETHQTGGWGSIGYRYDWRLEEAQKNILRTHTTAVSARHLQALAKEYRENGFTPKKFFSIDRVFRNEEPDPTHLCEFQQIEGMVVDKGLTLGDLIGLFTTFFKKIGIEHLVFKPAYNPYTEPSMEIFTKRPGKDELIEVGNSGIFRPEMLRPMGFEEDVTVLAWGLGLERPTMVLYGIKNIRDLVGYRIDVQMIRSNPIVDFVKMNERRTRAEEEEEGEAD